MQTFNSSLSLPGHRCSRAGPCCSQMLSTDLLFIVLVWPLMGQKANRIARISSVLKLKQHRAHKIFSCPDRYMLIAFCLLLANYSNSLGLKKKKRIFHFGCSNSVSPVALGKWRGWTVEGRL